jgi:rubrerythrin
MAALSLHDARENAVAYFSTASQQATDQEVRQFYGFLADWERQHLDALQGLHETIRSDFWDRSGFSPF